MVEKPSKYELVYEKATTFAERLSNSLSIFSIPSTGKPAGRLTSVAVRGEMPVSFPEKDAAFSAQISLKPVYILVTRGC
jgi:hypothetical protein